jgi:hypothetical protein
MSCPAFVIAIACITGGAAPVAGTNINVRPMSPVMRGVIQEGLNRSPSFRGLMARLDGSDVVVYVRDERSPIGSLHGSLTFVSKAGGLRYLLVRLFHRSRVRHVAILGHELQHAVEIAERPEIVDEASLAQAYAQFGSVTRSRTAGGTHLADTTDAVTMAARVWRELAQPAGAPQRVTARRER